MKRAFFSPSSGLGLTAGKKAESGLRRHAERFKRLLEFHKAILSQGSAKAIADIALGHIRKLIPSFPGTSIDFDFERKKAKVISGSFDDHYKIKPGFTIPLGNKETLDNFKKGENPWK